MNKEQSYLESLDSHIKDIIASTMFPLLPIQISEDEKWKLAFNQAYLLIKMLRVNRLMIVPFIEEYKFEGKILKKADSNEAE